MKLSGIIAFTLALAPAALMGGCGPNVNAPSPPVASSPLSDLPLAKARAAHQTHLLTSGPAPGTGNPELGGNGQAVKYRSDGRTLTAWLVAPDDYGRHPAILYCHHGYALTNTDIETVQGFVTSGYVVLLPSYRGENGNTGSFEMFYGEVDDARAALDALAEVPAVDRNLMFAVGYGAGGTIAMLLAESGAPLRSVSASSAYVDYAGDLTNDPPWPDAPFDWHDLVEDDLRNPANHLKDLACPVHLYYGEDEKGLIALAQPLPAKAMAVSKTVTVTVIPGANEGDMVQPMVQDTVKDFGSFYTPPQPPSEEVNPS